MVLMLLAENSIQLVPDGTLILHVLMIAIMVFILNKSLLDPINRVLEERDRSTRGALGEAQRLLARIDSDLRNYEQALRSARTEAYRLMEVQRSEAMEQREVRMAALRTEILSLTESEKASIERQAQEAHKMLRVEAQEQGLTITTQILGRPLTSGPDGNSISV